MLSALMMFRRFERALRHAMREQNFGALLGAALTLIVVGTLAYTLGEDWSLVDGFYFAIATLTTSSIADPELVLTNAWLKVFYVLVGIGILSRWLGRRLRASVGIQGRVRRRDLLAAGLSSAPGRRSGSSPRAELR